MSSGKDILSMSADELRGLVLQVQATNPATLHEAQTSMAANPGAAEGGGGGSGLGGGGSSAADAAAGGGGGGGANGAPEVAAATAATAARPSDPRSAASDRLRKVDEASFRASRTRKENQKMAKVKSVMKKWTTTTTTATTASATASATTAATNTNHSARTTVPQPERQESPAFRPPPSSSSSSSSSSEKRSSGGSGRPAKKQKFDNKERAKANKCASHSSLSSAPPPGKETVNETMKEAARGGERHVTKASMKADASKKAAPEIKSATTTITPSRNIRDGGVVAPPTEDEDDEEVNEKRSHKKMKISQKDNAAALGGALPLPVCRMGYRSDKSLERTSLVSIDGTATAASSRKEGTKAIESSKFVPYWDTLGKCRLPRHQFAWPDDSQKALGYDAALGRVYYPSFSLSGDKYDVGDFVLRSNGGGEELFRIVAAYQATKSFLGAWSELDKMGPPGETKKRGRKVIPRSRKEEIQKRGHPYMLVCPLFSVDAEDGSAMKGGGSSEATKTEAVYLGPDAVYSPDHVDMLPQWLGEPDLELAKVEVQLKHDHGGVLCMGSDGGKGEKRFICGQVGLAGPGRSLAPLKARHASLLASSASDLIEKGHVPKSWDYKFEAEQVQFILEDRSPDYASRGVLVHDTAESSDDSDGFEEASARKLGGGGDEDSDDETETEDEDESGEDDRDKSENKNGAMARKRDGRKTEKAAEAETAKNAGTPKGCLIDPERRSRSSREKKKCQEQQEEAPSSKREGQKRSSGESEESNDATSADKTPPTGATDDDLDFVEADQPESLPIKRVAMASSSKKEIAGRKASSESEESNDATSADKTPPTGATDDDLDFVEADQPESPPIKRVAMTSSPQKEIAGRKRIF